MRPTPKDRALAFLLGEHGLRPAEAEEALAVAAPVLAEALARLARTADHQNARACTDAAHGLKGNLLNLGLIELAQTAEQACAAARQGDLDPAREVARTLGLALTSLLPSSDSADGKSCAANPTD